METLLFFLLVVAVGGALTLLIVYVRERSSSLKREDLVQQQLFAADRARHDALEQAKKLHAEVARLQPWKGVADASAKAAELIRDATARAESIETDARILRDSAQVEYERQVGAAKEEAKQVVSAAKQKAEGIETNAQQLAAHANRHAAAIVEEAERQAKLTAGKAFDAVKNAEQYERIANAMRNRIEGYGDRYIVPASSFLDALAQEMSHKEAGQALKRCRSQSAAMVNAGQASTCGYAEAGRRESAERFVVDAFNGRVDSILSRAKHDNYGTLHQEVVDAFDLVNFNGRAFRDAQVTQAYLFARQEELRWACIAQELKRQEQEEQRQIREQIREEEKARRDYERAIRETAKEEERLRTAMVKAQAQLAEASEAQKAKYEAQLAELSVRLQVAEERGQRAISMAQLTRRGHVYVISNLGSFGEHVYKIGLTRRLDPMDRIWELGDASVPFDFDVHAMIMSDDAPALERRLHEHFLLNQVNKVNHRKEFFRVAAADLRKELEDLGVVAQFTMLAEAKEYRETQAIERQIAENPAAREAWINRQFQLDPVKDEDRDAVSASLSEEE